MSISLTDITEGDLSRVRAVKAAYQERLLQKANVVGVGIGLRRRNGQPTGELALIVSVTRKVPRAELAPEDLIPSELEGVPVDVQEVGVLRALDSSTDRHGEDGSAQ